ncbi:MAG TPA: glutathione S-transferase family protein [Polyangiaceae bacterium]|nr:glutathione S-transferase family protein [Polyangiaceae bacterium]
MALEFYYVSGSPFSMRVHLSLEYQAQEYTGKPLKFSAGDLKRPEFLRMNPRAKVPVLVDDDFVLFESAAIVEYLDERAGAKRRLFPEDVRGRALARRMIREVDEQLGRLQGTLAGELFFKQAGEGRDEQRVRRAAEQFAAELVYFERQLRGDFLLGAVSAADLALYPFVAMARRFELRMPGLGLSEALGAPMRAWLDRVEALPRFENAYPPHWRS